MKIEKETKNSLLKRRELVIHVESESTPNFATLGIEIPAQLKVPAENIVIKEIKGKFGRKVFHVTVFVYDNPEMKLLVEQKPKAKKGGSA